MPKDLSSPGLTELRDNTVLRRVSQLGSARSGLADWKLQRLTAIMLAPLGLYFVASVLHLVTGEREAARLWLGRPINALLMLLFVCAVAAHAYMGVRSVVADYVHGKGALLIANLLVRAATIVFAVASTLAILEAFLRPGTAR